MRRNRYKASDSDPHGITRRDLLKGGAGLGAVLSSDMAALLTKETLTDRTNQIPSFWKSRLDDLDRAMKQVEKGDVRVLAKSAGKRDIYLASYGQKDSLATANYNSACGGKDPASYRHKEGKEKPVVLLLGPVHGQEIEGVVGLINLLAVAETGQDLPARPWPDLAANLGRCRTLIVPVCNPDGRARCSVNSWVGADPHVHERVGMGTLPNGTNYVWPGVKRFHPMRGALVGELGSYFNDHGVNLMHDEWFDPMAEETRAFLSLAQEEAPDFIVSLHSHSVHPSVEPTAYVPLTVKETIRVFADRLYARYRAAGLPAREAGPEAQEDGATFPPPSFNLASAIHHVCGGVVFVHECPCGVKDGSSVTPEQILSIEMLLYEELFRFAVERPVRWL